jgi:hypothetical protein
MKTSPDPQNIGVFPPTTKASNPVAERPKITFQIKQNGCREWETTRLELRSSKKYSSKKRPVVGRARWQLRGV